MDLPHSMDQILAHGWTAIEKLPRAGTGSAYIFEGKIFSFAP
jgi:hypothetical protein